MPKRRKTKRRKSAKRVARGKKLARSLPRDAKGKFLPKGSKNLFRGGKKRRRKSTGRKRPATKRTKRKLTRRRSAPAMSSRGRGVKSSDFFPNFISGALTQAAADAFTTNQTFTPIPRLKTIGNRATVMELLWIDIEFDIVMNRNDSEAEVFFNLGSIPTSVLRWNDPRVFTMFKLVNEFIAVGAGSGAAATGLYSEMRRFDMQSKDGFGYLLASDSFHVTFKSENTARANSVFWKMFYRFVDIPLSEFIGIVQSTQQS